MPCRIKNLYRYIRGSCEALLAFKVNNLVYKNIINVYCMFCGSILSLVQILFPFVLGYGNV